MKKLIFLGFLLGACGTDQQVEAPGPNPGPNPDPGPGPGQEVSFAEITEIHNEYCIACHANSGFIRSEALLKGSSAKQRVQNGSMPPNSKLPNEVKQTYLNFFSA